MKMWSGRFRQPLDADFERGSGRSPSTGGCCRTNWRPAARMRAALKNAGVLSSSELITILQGWSRLARRRQRRRRFWTTAKPKTCITLSRSSWSC